MVIIPEGGEGRTGGGREGGMESGGRRTGREIRDTPSGLLPVSVLKAPADNNAPRVMLCTQAVVIHSCKPSPVAVFQYLQNQIHSTQVRDTSTDQPRAAPKSLSSRFMGPFSELRHL